LDKKKYYSGKAGRLNSFSHLNFPKVG